METTHKLITYKGKTIIQVRHNNKRYVFRYAYDDKEQAELVRGNLEKNFGTRGGIETDLAFNYWRWPNTTAEIVERHHRGPRKTWYISVQR